MKLFMTKFTQITALFSISALMLTGCGNETPKQSASTEAAKPKQLLTDAMVMKAKPVDAITISAARKIVKPGQEVTVTGTIGGNKSPFVATRASMIMADHTVLKACRTEACTSCPTPWDYCCSPKEDLKKATLTVQFIDKDGMVLKQGLEGFNGMKKNGVVTIKGKFAENATKELVIINADKVFVEGK